MKRVKWTFVSPSGEPWNFARSVCGASTPIVRHCHDFAEVFWIESGRGVHLLNGCESVLEEGALVFLRPADWHAFHALRQETPFVLANFAVPAAVADSWHDRWKSYGLKKIPWGGAPMVWMLSPAQLAALGSIVRGIAERPSTALAGDRFLSSLMHELHREGTPLQLGPDAPEWLSRAISSLHKPEQLGGGVEAFFRACGRSREHVARACRLHLNLTPTDLINRGRLDYAARLLETTDLPVLEVGAEAGFHNPSLFHRRFRVAFQLSPLQYRHQIRSTLPS